MSWIWSTRFCARASQCACSKTKFTRWAAATLDALMHRMGIEALYRKPHTSLPDRARRIDPYLLSDLNLQD